MKDVNIDCEKVNGQTYCKMADVIEWFKASQADAKDAGLTSTVEYFERGIGTLSAIKKQADAEL